MLLISNIRLTSAVTVVSAADPVRVFQEFATLDLVSHGRAEIVAGRGSYSWAGNIRELQNVIGRFLVRTVIGGLCDCKKTVVHGVEPICDSDRRAPGVLQANLGADAIAQGGQHPPDFRLQPLP